MFSNHDCSHFDTGTAQPRLIALASVWLAPYRHVVTVASRVQRSRGLEAEQLPHSWLHEGQFLPQRGRALISTPSLRPAVKARRPTSLQFHSMACFEEEGGESL